MNLWKLDKARQLEIFTEVASQMALPVQAIEKDYWVTACLGVLFSSEFAGHIIFKGGTSLSKGWKLIARFSEDIDLSVSRELLGFPGELSKNQIKKLRKASCSFVSERLASTVVQGLNQLGAQSRFQIEVPASPDSDTDPQIIFVQYDSLVPEHAYLPARVKIEMGARALMEPVEEVPITSFVSETFPKADFVDAPFLVNAVMPKRTFLEKIFLLHETIAANPERVGDRMSRHLYDLECMMDTRHGQDAVQDQALYQAIVAFRQQYNPIKAVDYTTHQPATISFLPVSASISTWERDYRVLSESMIYNEALSFSALMLRLQDLQAQIRAHA